MIVGAIAAGFVSLAIATFVHAATGPTITTAIMTSGNATTTSAAIGSNVHDSIIVADPAASTTPTGTVNFNLFSGTSCSGAPTVQSGVSLVNGMASSNATTTPAGGLSYLVAYNGDSTFSAATSSCESLTATQLTPTVSTNILNASSNAVITSAIASTSVTDRATVTGAGATPTGTVDFTFYNNNACSSGSNAGSGISLSGNTATSSTEGALAAGSYSFKAHYNGDANYVAADGPCETLSIGTANVGITTALSSNSITAGNSAYDTAALQNTLSGAGGSVQYVVYTDNACSSALQGAGVMSVSNGSVPNSNSVLFNNPGTYYWQAAYSGDQNNAAATSTCSSEILNVLATSTPPATTTPGTINGEVFNDQNGNGSIDSGDNGLSGWKVQLSGFFWRFHGFFGFGKWGWNWGGAQTATTDANGNYSFANVQDGFYFVSVKPQNGWKATTPPAEVAFIQNGKVVNGINFGEMMQNATSTQGNGHGKGDDQGDDNGNGKDNGNHGQGNNGKHLGEIKHGKTPSGNNGKHEDGNGQGENNDD